MADVVHKYANKDETVVGYTFNCPGCKCAHAIRTRSNEGPVWSFAGTPERPTFSPSIHVNPPSLVPDAKPGDPPVIRCHSFVNDGYIQFLGDCTHTLAGQVHPLPPWKDD